MDRAEKQLMKVVIKNAHRHIHDTELDESPRLGETVSGKDKRSNPFAGIVVDVNRVIHEDGTLSHVVVTLDR